MNKFKFRSELSALAAITLGLLLTACGGGPRGNAARPAPIAGKAAPSGDVSDAIRLLNAGQVGPARRTLTAILKRNPSEKLALALLRQIDSPPQELLGMASFVYTVRAGDTMSSLAGRFLNDPMMFYALARYNGIAAPGRLEAGQRMRIPGKAPPEPAPQTVARPAPAHPEAVPTKPTVTAPAGAADSSALSRASKLRAAGLEQMNRGAIDRAVMLFQQAVRLAPKNGLIRRDLDRALRIQRTVRRRRTGGQMKGQDMRHLGRYELIEHIGEGAMADVHRAHDPSIDRVLAIKLLKPEFRANPEGALRFVREAKAAGALSHPAIVTIYDVGETEGFAYIAMELLDGESLDHVIARDQRLPIEAVLAIGEQLASALSYAHRSGVIHRDIKPSNIMLGRDGRTIKLLDFGIARVAETAADEGDAQSRTQIGQVVGTPRYMSPEQVFGHELDGRSDLFAVGLVLYELITGRQPFTGTGAATLALQITQQNPPSVSELAPHCPGGLRFIIEKLLSKRPERRFADGAELAKALKRERKAYEAVQADDAARDGYLPLTVRLTLVMVAITALALLASVGGVLDRQYQAMQRMALTSGSSMASFVATNAALPAVDNAGLPPEERDWLPVQAFIAAAAKDESVRWMTMVDSEGIIRGSSDPSKLGTHYHPPTGETLVEKSQQTTITDIELTDGRAGFRFVHPILYAGRTFGIIEVSISKTDLQAAAATSRNLLIMLGLVVLLVVAGGTFTAAKFLGRPVRRLKSALRDATMGDLDFRLSHGRKDEFGELFDAFNLFVDTVQERLAGAERGTGGPRSMDATLLDAAPPIPVAMSDPSGTPFAALRRRA